MKLFRLIALSLTLLAALVFSGCSNADKDVIEPTTPPTTESVGTKVYTVKTTSDNGSDSKLSLDKTDYNTIAVTWKTSDVMGSWSYNDDGSDQSSLDKVVISDISSNGEEATFNFTASADITGARFVYPLESTSSSIEENKFDINLSRQNITPEVYESGTESEKSTKYLTTHDKMYLVSDKTTPDADDSFTVSMKHITSLLAFKLSWGSDPESGDEVYKIVVRKSVASDGESVLKVSATIDLDAEEDSDLVTLNDLASGDLLELTLTEAQSVGTNDVMEFVIPSLPITFYPTEKLYIDVYLSTATNKYVYTAEYTPTTVGTTEVGGYYSVDVSVPNIGGVEVVEESFDGLGTANSPYLIADFDDLKMLSEDVAAGYSYENTYFEVSEDITFNDLFTSIGSETAPFKGIFDGGKKTISYGEGYATNGLFGYISGATIKNVNVTGEINVSGDTYIGGIAGYSKGGSIIYNSIAADVTITDSNTNLSIQIGGLTGSNEGSVLGCAVVDLTVTSYNTIGKIGGLIGENSGEVVSCYATIESIPADGAIGTDPLISSNSGEYSGLYSTGSSNYGSTIEDANSSDFIDAINEETATYNLDSPTLRLTAWETGDSYAVRGITYPSNSTVSAEWIDLIPLSYVDITTLGNELVGSGTEADPWLIQSEYDLALLSKYYSARAATGSDNDYGKYYLLTTDLDLSGRYWEPIGIEGTTKFDGVFDGANHTINGMNVSKSAKACGLFRFIVSADANQLAVVKNLKMTNATVTVTGSNNQNGILAAAVGIYGLVANISVEGTITTAGSITGGIIGQQWSGVVLNCHSKVTITSSATTTPTAAQIGGICGLFDGTDEAICGCFSDFTLGSQLSVSYGGITAKWHSAGYIKYSYWRDVNANGYTDYTPYAYSKYVSNAYVGYTDDIADSITNVTSYDNADIVAALNDNQATWWESSYNTTYEKYGITPYKWKLDENGEVAIDYGTYYNYEEPTPDDVDVSVGVGAGDSVADGGN